MREKFKVHALSSSPTLDLVAELKKVIGNTMTMTFYSLIETLDVLAFGLITDHPKKPAADFDPHNPCRYVITSPPFDAQYGHVTDTQLYSILKSYCRNGKWDLGRTETIIANSRNERHIFSMETIFNHYDALTLGVLMRKHEVSVVVSF